MHAGTGKVQIMFVHVPTIQRHCRQSFHVHLQIPQGTGQMNSSERQSTKEPSEAVRPQSILAKCQGKVFSFAPLGWALLRNAHQARFPPVEARKSKYVCLTSPKGKGCLSIGVGRLALHNGQPRSIKNFQLQSTTCYYLLLPWWTVGKSPGHPCAPPRLPWLPPLPLAELVHFEAKPQEPDSK
jgi:hypothetical protein